MQSQACANQSPRTASPAVKSWSEPAAVHRARVAPLAEAFLARRARGEKHPVWDFLFTYYSFSPAKLMTWTPGAEEISSYNPQSTIGEATDDEAIAWEVPPLT